MQYRGATLYKMPFQLMVNVVVALHESMLTFNNSIIYPLLSGKDNIKMFFSVLEALGFGFDPPVSVQHVQYAVLCVSSQL